jgi:hypothetical protein
VSIEIGRLGPDAVALGAATLVVERFLASGGLLRAAQRSAESSRGGRAMISRT